MLGEFIGLKALLERKKGFFFRVFSKSKIPKHGWMRDIPSIIYKQVVMTFALFS